MDSKWFPPGFGQIGSIARSHVRRLRPFMDMDLRCDDTLDFITASFGHLVNFCWPSRSGCWRKLGGTKLRVYGKNLKRVVWVILGLRPIAMSTFALRFFSLQKACKKPCMRNLLLKNVTMAVQKQKCFDLTQEMEKVQVGRYYWHRTNGLLHEYSLDVQTI